jgi:chemotaxis protein MotB
MEEERPKRRQEEEEAVAGWQTIYCSLALILVALFAMLVTYSSIEKEKMSAFKEGSKLIKEGESSGLDTMMLSRRLAADREKSIVQAIHSLDGYLERAGLSNSVHVKRTPKGFKAAFESHVLFPSGVAVINREAYPSLDEIARIAKEGMFALRVEGHTDNVPIHTPQFPSNWELSTIRAVNVLRYLRERGDLIADKLSAVGFGQYQPLVSNNTSGERQQNRRIEFYFELQEV